MTASTSPEAACLSAARSAKPAAGKEQQLGRRAVANHHRDRRRRRLRHISPLLLLLAAVRIVTWVAIAGFMAIVLAPLVSRLDRRLAGRRTVATGTVVVGTLLVLAGVIALFIMPVRTQLVNIITDLPGTVHDAADGKGPVGNIVHKLHVESYVKDNEAKLASAAKQSQRLVVRSSPDRRSAQHSRSSRSCC